MKIMNVRLFLTVIAFLILVSSIYAADPPGLINYQGILRDSSDKPRNGNYDMTFTFFSASSGGDKILIDQHQAAGTGAVTVSDGLFNVWLGGGNILDGPGPGTYTNLSQVFSNYTNVYLAIDIYNPDTTLWETLNPRIRIISAAYSLNADNLDGKNSLDFLDTSSTTQTKSGKAIFTTSTGNYGIEGYGPVAGGYFKDSGQSGYSYVGYGHYGIQSSGNTTGGYFYDLDSSGRAFVGYGDRGIYAYGNSMGGDFYDIDSSGIAYIAYGDDGIRAWGENAGGYFKDYTDSGYAYVGYGHIGISAYGNNGGGRFTDSDHTGEANVGYANYGVYAKGSFSGGYFFDTDSTGLAYVGYGNYGVNARGSTAGGYFFDTDSSGYAYAGYGDRGIHALGLEMGGYFKDSDHSGYVHAGYGNYGVYAMGTFAGGYFGDSDHSGYAQVGYEDYGIRAYGNYDGGYFESDYVGGWGVEARGQATGGYFSDIDSGSYCRAGYSTYKTQGSGTNAFVQNHPYNKDRVIVYAAPEGDEVATYTRGTANLIDGEARVPLGETFQWVTNPDIGLTAYVTPQQDCHGLYVESVSTAELVVRELNGGTSNVSFDYVVLGLRIGFEEISIIQTKNEESYIPSMKDHRDLYAQHPELRQYNALERFKGMRFDKGERVSLDLSASLALKSAIEEYDYEIHGKITPKRLGQEVLKPDDGVSGQPQALVGGENLQDEPSSSALGGDKKQSMLATVPMDEDGNIHAKSFRSVSPDLTGNVPVSEQAEVGDVLVMDPMNPGMMRLAETASDPAVVGIVAGEPGVVLGGGMINIDKSESEGEQQLEGIPVDTVEESQADSLEEGESYVQDQHQPETGLYQAQAPVALSGIVLCKVDAGYGSIQMGDLLTTSPTKGHAMRSVDYAPGTIIGKALEPLDAGIGLIKVLVFTR
jgi:hypothetical protein